MRSKLKVLLGATKDTKVLRGSRSVFIFFFFLTHGINRIGHYSPRFARLLRHIPHQKEFTIKNSVGVFEVTPFGDSMTVSSNYFESHLLPWIIKPRQKRVFVDIGAHIGRYTILAINRFHYKKVIAIEANPDTFAMLKKNVQLNHIENNVTLVQMALSNRTGKVEFESDKYNLIVGHVRTSKHNGLVHENNKIIEIESDQGTSVLDTNKVKFEDIDFIKMDVEGFEPEVLDGMRQVLQKMQRGSCVMVEISDPASKKAESVLEQYSFQLLSSNQADYLFVKE
jgi:FkbM family methyltransferase